MAGMTNMNRMTARALASNTSSRVKPDILVLKDRGTFDLAVLKFGRT